jgi:hypothetical protein
MTTNIQTDTLTIPAQMSVKPAVTAPTFSPRARRSQIDRHSSSSAKTGRHHPFVPPCQIDGCGEEPKRHNGEQHQCRYQYSYHYTADHYPAESGQHHACTKEQYAQDPCEQKDYRFAMRISHGRRFSATSRRCQIQGHENREGHA